MLKENTQDMTEQLRATKGVCAPLCLGLCLKAKLFLIYSEKKLK